MKNKFINELAINEKITGQEFAIKGVKCGKTVQGKDYFDLILSDKTGEITGKIWEDNMSNCQEPEKGQVVSLSAEVKEFRGKPQLDISFLEQSRDFDLQSFLPASEKNIDDLWQTVQANVEQIKHPDLKRLLNSFFGDKDFVEKFKKAPGAEKIHHAYLGGLMEHVVEMLNLAHSLFESYPELDKDLLITGVLLHDVGKMQELGFDTCIYRTLEGNLIGHISLGAIWVDKKMEQNFPRELRAKLLNMLLSHHGRQEFGSPVLPMSRESLALAHIDNTSAKVSTADRIIQENKDSEEDFSDRDFFLKSKIYLK
ncbi:MAG TPA: HD domain-containing protein [Patescibacteria group bacterium]|nr:HD domain-containing protein [Patescibacteria group bacterium]